MNVVNQVVCLAHLESKNSAAGDEGTQEQSSSCPVDSGFDLPNFPKDSDGFDSREADATPSRPKVRITATLADGLVVSSGGAEITL